MNRLRLIPFLLTVLLLTTLVSCDKDDDVEPNKNELLTAHAWQGKAIYINGHVVPDNTITLDIKSFRVTFTDDRTFTASYKINGVPQMEEGLWDLNDNNTKMNFPFLNQPGEFSDVMRLTANNFDVSAILSDANGQKQAIEFRFIPSN